MEKEEILQKYRREGVDEGLYVYLLGQPPGR